MRTAQHLIWMHQSSFHVEILVELVLIKHGDTLFGFMKQFSQGHLHLSCSVRHIEHTPTCSERPRWETEPSTVITLTTTTCDFMQLLVKLVSMLWPGGICHFYQDGAGLGLSCSNTSVPGMFHLISSYVFKMVSSLMHLFRLEFVRTLLLHMSASKWSHGTTCILNPKKVFTSQVMHAGKLQTF